MYKGKSDFFSRLKGMKILNKLIVKVGSVTYALKAKDILQNRGIASQIKKTANPSKGEGCGYSVIIPDAGDSVIGILRLSGIEILDTVWVR